MNVTDSFPAILRFLSWRNGLNKLHISRFGFFTSSLNFNWTRLKNPSNYWQKVVVFLKIPGVANRSNTLRYENLQWLN